MVLTLIYTWDFNNWHLSASLHLVTHDLLTFLEANLHVQSTCFNGCNSGWSARVSLSPTTLTKTSRLKGHCVDKAHARSLFPPFLLTNRNLNTITSATNSPGVSSAFRKYLSAGFWVLVRKEHLSCLCCVKALSVLLSPNLHPHISAAI